MKTILSIVCLMLVCAAVDAQDAKTKRSILFPTTADVSSTPVVHSSVFQPNANTLVKTQQVRAADRATFALHTEVRANPFLITDPALLGLPTTVNTNPFASTPFYQGFPFQTTYPFFPQFVVRK